MEQDGGETDNIVAGQRDFITLAQPRPGTARRQNEYIETPLRPELPAPKVTAKTRLKDENELCRGRPKTRQPPAITAQPTVKKDNAVVSDGPADVPDHNDSIICRQCRRCKCEACRNPRHLPSKWICNNKCLCSASNIVDYCSCMCCVRGLFYHWAKDYEMDTDVSCADQPCSCSPHKRLLRWGCLGLLALPLPCLCCYWPLRGCLKACEGCYSKCTGHGCRCAPPHRTEQAPEKKLLDSNSDC
ncbi:UNVERIFIED_CONTAM: sty [Trichonephila clavipes]